MTPQEKAWNLFESYINSLLDVGLYRDDVKNKAINCALLCVKEIESYKEQIEKEYDEDLYLAYEQENYWKEVIQELHKL